MKNFSICMVLQSYNLNVQIFKGVKLKGLNMIMISYYCIWIMELLLIHLGLLR